jgi:NAD-dependent deacetylase
MTTFTSVVVLTGAGISAESGINTFRAADGLWENHRVEDVATPEAFIRDPQLVHTFYNARRRQLLDGIQPNDAHLALAAISKNLPERVTLVTQNIDNLHHQAGHITQVQQALYPMHGELLKIRCKVSNELFDCLEDTSPQDHCPCCDTAGNLRPHVVWFGEMPLYMAEIERALHQCDLFIAIGTSGNVYPAAGFFQTAKFHGAHTVELNLEPSTSGSSFNEQHYGPATEVVPTYFNSLKIS